MDPRLIITQTIHLWQTNCEKDYATQLPTILPTHPSCGGIDDNPLVHGGLRRVANRDVPKLQETQRVDGYDRFWN